MAYAGPIPFPVPSGGTGASTLTGVLIGAGTSAVTGNPITQHDVLVGGASNTITSVTPSTAGFVFTSNGASIDPSFQAPSASSGPFVKLQTLTASNSASVAFTSTFITNTYSAYFITFQNIISVTNGVTFVMDWSTDNGSTYLNTNFQSGNTSNGWNSATIVNTNSTSTNPLVGTASQSNVFPTSGQVYIYIVGTSLLTNMVGQFYQGANTYGSIYGGRLTAITLNNVKFSMTSGNISTGIITLYGIVS